MVEWVVDGIGDGFVDFGFVSVMVYLKAVGAYGLKFYGFWYDLEWVIYMDARVWDSIFWLDAAYRAPIKYSVPLTCRFGSLVILKYFHVVLGYSYRAVEYYFFYQN